MPDHTPTQVVTSGSRLAFVINAAVAWLGVVLVLVLTLFDAYGGLGYEPEVGLYAERPAGWAGAPGRMLDSISYFTMWSNIVVAVAMTGLARSPGSDSVRQWSLRLSGLVMITLTAIVYAIFLAPAITLSGWSRLTNPLQHIVVPGVTVVVWLIWGPRGRINRRVLLPALVVPMAWMVFMLSRGAIDGTYPYGFTNVTAHGYGVVAVGLGVTLLLGVAIMGAFWGGDVALCRMAGRREGHPVE